MSIHDRPDSRRLGGIIKDLVGDILRSIFIFKSVGTIAENLPFLRRNLYMSHGDTSDQKMNPKVIKDLINCF